MVKPVTPVVIDAARPNVDAEVTRINEALSRPWTSYERMYGRCITPSGSGAEREEVVRLFIESGWSVEFVSDQRDGDFLRFRPARAHA